MLHVKEPVDRVTELCPGVVACRIPHLKSGWGAGWMLGSGLATCPQGLSCFC